MDNSDSSDTLRSEPKTTCGVIMPISTIDNCSAEHWLDVRALLFEAIEEVGFFPQMVSDAEEVGVIQKRIVENVYLNPIVVCDVSGRNSNVMFELGMRLAFDKPTVIVKDDKTNYSFDTSVIEHLEYPRDLRYSKIVEFQERLAEKIQNTHDRSTSDPNYTTFLKHFGAFNVAKVDTRIASKEDVILEEVRALKTTIAGLQARPVKFANADQQKALCLSECSSEVFNQVLTKLQANGFPVDAPHREKSPRHYHLSVENLPTEDRLKFLKMARTVHPKARFQPRL